MSSTEDTNSPSESESPWYSAASETPTDWCVKKPVPPKDPCHVNTTVPLSSLCERGWQPLLITGLLRDVLARHFTEETQIESPDLRQYLWREDERSGILIESVYRWRGDVVEKRPAILVKRNAYTILEYAINNFIGITGRDTQVQEQGIFWVGSHSLFCLHGTGASVELLATEVQRFLTAFAQVFRKDLGLAKFAVTEVGAISEVEEAREHYVVPITVGWAFQEKWGLRYESLPTRRMPLSILLDGERLQ